MGFPLVRRTCFERIPRETRGFPVGFPWVVIGFPTSYPWGAHGEPIKGFPCISREFSVGTPRVASEVPIISPLVTCGSLVDFP